MAYIKVSESDSFNTDRFGTRPLDYYTEYACATRIVFVRNSITRIHLTFNKIVIGRNNIIRVYDDDISAILFISIRAYMYNKMTTIEFPNAGGYVVKIRMRNRVLDTITVYAPL